MPPKGHLGMSADRFGYQIREGLAVVLLNTIMHRTARPSHTENDLTQNANSAGDEKPNLVVMRT